MLNKVQAKKYIDATENSSDLPLARLQAYLEAIKKCVSVLRDVLVEVKDLLVIVTVIVFFAIGVWEALNRLIAQPPRSEAQTVSRPYEQDRR